MAPFNMRCKTCGEYIYKGKKFNARKEDVEGDDYMGIRIYRFYIKCTRCLQEISFKTDPKNTDYEIEAGASRNFMALKMAEEQAQREEDEEREEEATNPMKLLEKRTQQSKHELELLESLEELKDLNRRQQTIDYEQMLDQYDTQASRIKKEKEQEELDEQFVKSIFKKKENVTTVEEEIVELEDEVYESPKKIFQKDDLTTSTEKVVRNCEFIFLPVIFAILVRKTYLINLTVTWYDNKLCNFEWLGFKILQNCRTKNSYIYMENNLSKKLNIFIGFKMLYCLIMNSQLQPLIYFHPRLFRTSIT